MLKLEKILPVKWRIVMEINSMNGRFCSGSGDIAYLKLIEESFEMMHPTPNLPNISMLYNEEQNTFAEGFFWTGWWIQNSYGFAYSAVPYLSEPWISILQNSLDLFWDRIGDGKRCGADNEDAKTNKMLRLVAPDGSLGDCVSFNQGIFYKQGDGEVDLHDWFYEATAAGVVMQAEILLRSRSIDKIKKYLPLMERSCNSIENIRDSRNNLFLAGPASTLLAPSYGGALNHDGSIGKGYPSGIAITYTAALQRMRELFKMINETKKENEYLRRTEITQTALPLLMTGEGYFVKSMDKDGTLHGVFGKNKYGYLEGVANADALAFDVVDRNIREKIYNKISEVNDIRPFDFLLTNFPSLDDTYEIYLGKGHHGFFTFGDWVNGGCWGTVEGRATLGYLKLNRFNDAFKSALRAMMWAKEYRMDAPFSQCGENTYNPWSDRKDVSLISVMVDNFAIPAATLRGLFEYNYTSSAVTLIPHIPSDISEYIQHEPVWLGDKRIYISVINGESIKKVTINGKPFASDFTKGIVLEFDFLPNEAYIKIIMSSLKNAGEISFIENIPYAVSEEIDISKLSEELKHFYYQFSDICNNFRNCGITGKQYNYALEVLQAIKACALRKKKTFKEKKYLRPMNEHKKAEIFEQYEKAAMALTHSYFKAYR
jgi:hypothetical protein